MELPELPQPWRREPDSEHDGDGGPLVDHFTADQMLAYGEQCALAERERIESSEVIQFLYGAGDLDGVGYSEAPPGKPRYWWRTILRSVIKGTE